jgi:hypothetical protein
MILVETIPIMGRGRNKENGGKDEFKYIWYNVRTFVNATIYSTKHTNKEERFQLIAFSVFNAHIHASLVGNELIIKFAKK